MQWLDVPSLTLADQLALDEALLLQAEAGQGGEILRIWEWPSPAVVLGAGGKLAAEVNEAAARADGVPILRRSSGGGTVLLGAGCLCFSLVLAYERSPALREIPFSYVHILDRIGAALGDLAAGIEHAGTSDLAMAGRKFSGNAQQRKRDHLLHHGTILYQFDIGALDRYLRLPERQPEYRQGRRHADFVCNLPADRAGLTERLRKAWQAEQEAADWPAERVRQLVAEKYSTEAWLRRR